MLTQNTDGAPQLSPDGQWLAFASEESGHWGNYRRTSTTYVRANYDVSPDGQRFLMLKPVEQEEAPLTEFNVVINWSEELKRFVPPEK